MSEPGDAAASPDVPEPDDAALRAAGVRPVTDLKKPSTLGGAIYLGVLVGAVIGVVITASGAWRSGVSWLATALIVAAVARLVLPNEQAGMLRVRHKAIDASMLLLSAVTILVLAATIPNQPR